MYEKILSNIPARYVQTTAADFDASGDYTGLEEYIILPANKPSGYKIVNLNVKGVATNGDYLTSCQDMFRNNPSLYLELDYLDTSNVTDMSHMFRDSKATTLDLSSFDTSKVTNMNAMFFGSQATTLDLSSFDTSKVTIMYYMFDSCQATTLDLSSFDTSKLTNLTNMFQNSRATTLDLSSFDTSKVTTMSNMFRNSQATTLDLSSFDTSKVTTMSNMFNGSQATTGYARTQADADNFNNSSSKPNTLTFVVQTLLPQGETWLINESINASTLPNTSINFTSNEMSFSSIYYYVQCGAATIFYGDKDAWAMGVWINHSYRTITFETAPTGNLLTWLQANAVRQ